LISLENRVLTQRWSALQTLFATFRIFSELRWLCVGYFPSHRELIISPSREENGCHILKKAIRIVVREMEGGYSPLGRSPVVDVLLADPLYMPMYSELVRYAIAKGLQESSNPSALALVVPLFNDDSFYVRRAAGLTALSLGDKNGVSIVLETLQYETLDTGDNYGDNIYKQLSTYLGVDFGLDKQAWINWWNQVKDDFQLPIRK